MMHSLIKKYCSPEWYEFAEFHSETRNFGPNETIFQIGDKTEGLFLINKGRVKILTASANNKERIIRLAAGGDILGHRGFGGNWTYSITAIALTETEVTFIPIKIFNQIVKANAEFGFYMMMFFAEELRESESLAKQLPVKNLVASVIYEDYKTFGLEDGSDTKLSFTLTRKDIANKAGTTYESVVRSLSELNKEGTIRIDGKAIHVLNLEGLKNLSNGG